MSLVIIIKNDISESSSNNHYSSICMCPFYFKYAYYMNQLKLFDMSSQQHTELPSMTMTFDHRDDG